MGSTFFWSPGSSGPACAGPQYPKISESQRDLTDTRTGEGGSTNWTSASILAGGKKNQIVRTETILPTLFCPYEDGAHCSYHSLTHGEVQLRRTDVADVEAAAIFAGHGVKSGVRGKLFVFHIRYLLTSDFSNGSLALRDDSTFKARYFPDFSIRFGETMGTYGNQVCFCRSH